MSKVDETRETLNRMERESREYEKRLDAERQWQAEEYARDKRERECEGFVYPEVVSNFPKCARCGGPGASHYGKMLHRLSGKELRDAYLTERQDDNRD